MIVLFSELDQEMFDKSPLVNYESVAIIPNAKDTYTNSLHANNIKNLFENNNFVAEIVDLNEYSDDALFEKLSKFDIVHVIGGNTFTLLYAMRKSGFDKTLPDLLKKGIVYSGQSAGAMVLSPTIEPFRLIDYPELSPLKDMTGLGYLDFLFVPHASNPKYVDRIKNIEDNFSKEFNFKEFNDDQGLIINEKTKEMKYF